MYLCCIFTLVSIAKGAPAAAAAEAPPPTPAFPASPAVNAGSDAPHACHGRAHARGHDPDRDHAVPGPRSDTARGLRSSASKMVPLQLRLLRAQVIFADVPSGCCWVIEWIWN